MPTPIELQRFYAELRAQERRERRLKKFWDSLFCYGCILIILACGLSLWIVAPK